MHHFIIFLWPLWFYNFVDSTITASVSKDRDYIPSQLRITQIQTQIPAFPVENGDREWGETWMLAWLNRASSLTKHSSQLEKTPGRIHPSFCAFRVVKFRRTGESSRSDEDGISGEHEVQIEGVRTELEPVELGDGAAVPKEFANPTDGEQARSFSCKEKVVKEGVASSSQSGWVQGVWRS